jgi:AcrR family transcriptional regulator
MRRGRRPGPSTTREALLETARQKFAEAGYGGTSIRAIAADAGVDPALAVHFFGSKENLFREAIGWPFDPSQVAQRIQEGPGSFGERLARTFLEIWEEPRTRRPLLAVLRGAMNHEQSAILLRQFLGEQLFVVVGEPFDVELAVSHLLGVALLRHVLQIEPLASASIESIVAQVAPTIDRYFSSSPR